VFFDISIAGKDVGRIEFKLFPDLPITCKNFKQLCTGERGMGRHAKKLHYRWSRFHRIIPEFMVQGGDITHGDGTGGESTFSDEEFADENFRHKHTCKGLLSMANKGSNTNSSQFFITLIPAPWLDNDHVVFGKVSKGFNVVEKIAECGSEKGKPSKEVFISDCGIL